MISQSNAFNAAGLQGRLDFLNLGTDVAHVLIFATSRPANGAAPGGPPLVSIPLQDPAGSVVGSSLVITPSADTLVTTTGVGVWGRMVNGNGDHVLDGDVSNVGGSGDFQLNIVNLFLGGVVRLVSAVFG